MVILKYIMLFLILIACSILGRILSSKYKKRLKELEEMKTALNMFKTKINFTYDTIPEIFGEISEKIKGNVGLIFKDAKSKMKENTADLAWEDALEKSDGYLDKEDIYTLKTLSKLLGKTDVEGQISQIDITQKFLENQINEAIIEKQKNEKLYQKLGITIGLVIAIILA